MMRLLKKLFGGQKPTGKLYPECTITVTVGSDAIVCTNPGELDRTVCWADLTEVAIVTNDQGPWFADVWWHLVANGSECAVPQGATGEDSLIEALQALPGFDHEQMIAAITCVDNRRFVCWQRHKGEQLGGANSGSTAAAPE